MTATSGKKIKVLLVEDSPVQREYLIHILESDPDLKVMAFASNGLEALELLKKIKPDIILTDLHMPKMNGIEMIGEIMKSTPLPIVANSSSGSLDDMINGFNALKAGAVAFAEKPRGLADPRSQADAVYLVQTIKLMSEVAVVKRRNEEKPNKKITSSTQKLESKIDLSEIKSKLNLIVIGVSTGGPLVLQNIISNLKNDFPPILIVQHIAPNFINGLAEWLTQTTKRTVQIATDGDSVKRGHVYLAPDLHQMEIHANFKIKLVKAVEENVICPSIAALFTSAAKNVGSSALGILLTGMGSDGAEELKLMKDSGALTIAQSKESSLIFGMPAKAIALHAEHYVMSPDEIVELINALSTSSGGIA